MAKVQTIRRRIKSVKNINQITKAMQMVAASKLRRAQEATQRSRQYALASRQALRTLRLLTSTANHALFAERTIQNQLVILFTSDRGLAGAYNSNIFKAFIEFLKDHPERATKVIVIGQKGGQFLSRLQAHVEVVGVYQDWPTEPSTQDLQPIIATAIALFTAGAVDSVELLYTDFLSTVRQVVTTQTLLPINPAEILPTTAAESHQFTEALFEPSAAEVLTYIVPRFLGSQIYQANLEAIAAEQAMRMLAMKNASDNAKDIMGDLTLTYNGIRQAAITQELSEISAGAEAMTN
jgi:F-type H+-transporting ATPase subunit gamma